ncbi:MAG: glycosyltransferase family 4 protein [Planctomycetes bacterium]|nr:glycosyltransferase family 4 protein [Planctomycetota bacterium]
MQNTIPNYPRVLVVTSSTFNPYTGTGILLTNLFKGWPIGKIAMIHSDSFYHNDTACKNSYKLSFGECAFTLPLFTNMNKMFGGRMGRSESTSGNNHSKNDGNSTATKTIIRKVYEHVNRVLGGQEVYLKYVVSDSLLQWINQFRPEILYCHISSLMNLRFVRELKNVLKIPLCIHIMDHWLSVRYNKGLFASKLKSDFYQEFESLLVESSLRMGIGRKMCDAYEEKFGCSFKPYSNVVDPAIWLKSNDKKRAKDRKFSIVYAGTINTKNVRNLETICKIVEQLYSQKMNCQLKIYTFQPRVEIYRPMFEKKPFVIMGEVPKRDEDMISLLKGADLLFLPIDFTKVSIERMRYSMFAKIPAYMISGTPILVYGPPEVGVVEYAIEEKWAYVVSRKDEKALKDAIIELISNTVLRENLRRRAQELGIRDFDAKKVREAFQRAIANAASSQK